MGSKIVLGQAREILHNKNVKMNHWFNTLLFSVLALISMKPSGHIMDNAAIEEKIMTKQLVCFVSC